jgi:hypothetical protein
MTLRDVGIGVDDHGPGQVDVAVEQLHRSGFGLSGGLSAAQAPALSADRPGGLAPVADNRCRHAPHPTRAPAPTPTPTRTLVFAHANGFPAGTYRSLFDHWRHAGWRVLAPGKARATTLPGR